MKKQKTLWAALLLASSMTILSGCGGIVSSNDYNKEPPIPTESSDMLAENQPQYPSENNSEVNESETIPESTSASESESESESASKPVSSESPSESASKPGSSESASKPGSSESTSKPGSSESASKPGSSESVSKPGSSESASKPNSSESASNPGSSSAAESKPQQKPSGSESSPETPAVSEPPVNPEPEAPAVSEPPVDPEPEIPSSNGVHLEMFRPVTQEEQNTAALITSSIINDSMSEYQKVRAIHDYLVNHVAYSYNFSDMSVYTAQGAFNGAAVCQGYTDAFSLLCCNAGIQAEIVSGRADNGRGGPQDHAWNLVRIDGTWYQVDVTWDDPVGAEVTNYNYFLVTDSQIGQNHFADYYSHQYACTDGSYRAQHLADALNMHADYYYPGISKHYVTNKAEIADAIASESLVSGTTFIIMWHNELASEPITSQDVYSSIEGAFSGSCQYFLDDNGNATENFVSITIP